MIRQSVIYEDDAVLVLHKPANMATQTSRLGEKDAVSELKNYLAGKSAGKGEPYVGVIHRLDQPVEGLLVFAKNKVAAAELSKQLQNHTMKKYYYALVMRIMKKRDTGHILTDKNTEADKDAIKEKDTIERVIAELEYTLKDRFIPEEKYIIKNELKDYLVQDKKINRSHSENEHNGKEAYLQYRILKEESDISLLEIELETGRHHQIRVQLSEAGMPILGDFKYGTDLSKEKSNQLGCNQIALCAFKLDFNHPKSKEPMTFRIEPSNPIFSCVYSSICTCRASSSAGFQLR